MMCPSVAALDTTPGLDVAALPERRQLADLLAYPLIVTSMVPLMLLYPFVARSLTREYLAGAVKG